MSEQNRTTDQFGWGEVFIDPPAYDFPPMRNGDVVNLTRRNTADDEVWQPREQIIGPVRGQAPASPWFGNAEANKFPQSSQAVSPDSVLGPVRGGINGVISWRQWLAAVEVPDSSAASEAFASVYEFPYAFRS